VVQNIIAAPKAQRLRVVPAVEGNWAARAFNRLNAAMGQTGH
jgi:hypothetical protein